MATSLTGALIFLTMAAGHDVAATAAPDGDRPKGLWVHVDHLSHPGVAPAPRTRGSGPKTVGVKSNQCAGSRSVATS